VSISAQTLSQNQKGEKIVLYEDGSWRYYNAKDPNDVALLEQSRAASKSKTNKYEKEKPKKKKVKKQRVKKQKTAKVKSLKKNKSKSEVNKKDTKYAKQPKAKKSKSKKSKSYTKSAPSKKSNKSKKSKRAPTANSSNVDYLSVINKEIIGIRDKQNRALEKERVANFATEKYQRELKIAKNRKLSKSKIKQIESKYKEAALQLKMARNQNKVLLKQRRAYESVLRKEPGAQGKYYAKLAQKYNKDFKLVPTFDDDEGVVDATKKTRGAKKSKKTKKAQANSREIFTENSMEASDVATSYEVSYPSRKRDSAEAALAACKISFQGKDSFSGKKRTDLARSPFFSFTSKKMRPYFLEGDMIQCDAYLSAVAGGYKFICIEVLVSSETAQKSYGSLEKQGLLSIRLVDGTTVSLYNNKTDTGFLDPIKKTVTYKAQYLIPSEHVKALSRVDLDRVRLVWSTGYEDYTIYETDFLINQLACLEK